MLVLSFEWMNTLQPTLCVILFHAFESSIIFQKPSFYGLSGRPRAMDRFPRGHCFGWLSSNSSYHRKWRPTYENSVMAVSTVVVISFSNILLKLVILEKSSPTGLFCVLLSTRACISLVVLLKNTTVMGLKRWRCGKKISQTRPAHRVGSSDSRSSEMEET